MLTRMTRLVLFLFLFLLAFTCPGHGQQPETGPPADAAKLGTLKALVDSMAAAKAELAQANQRVKSAANDAEKKDAQKDAEDLEKRLDEAQQDFERVATGVEDAGSDEPAATKFDLGTEFNELLGPMVQELKKATAQPREIDRLREEVGRQQKRLDQAKGAVAGLKSMLASLPKGKEGSPDAALRKALEDVLDDWKNTAIDTEGSLRTAAFKLNDAIHNRKSIWELLSYSAESFFMRRGVNILLAIAFFLAAFLGWRAVHPLLLRFSPLHRDAMRRPFVARAMDVVFHSLALVMGVIAALMVLYVQGDWLLLGLSLIAVMTVLLAAKNGLPKYYIQARLLLNLGEVREGERVLVNGLPWQVKSINMFTDLVNPTLRNGHLRLPISQIVGMGSRPVTVSEPWFPCKEDDWVLLADGTFGKAVCLTPEFVQLVQLGGAFKTYTTAHFLAANPVTFANGFRISAIIKVHPDHRADAVSVIPEAVQSAIEKGLAGVVERHDQVRSVKVEFRAVIPDALEFDVVADFDGTIAEKYPALQRAVQRFALQALNANGWKLGG